MFIKRLGNAFGPDHPLSQNVTTLAHLVITYFGLRVVVNMVAAVATG